MRKIMMLAGARTAALLVGALIVNGGEAAADQVIPDDLIVQFSECVGLDCVNGEAFNFATLRLKENNTRIDFTDTSGAGFAARDWRIEANSSAGGGANYLALKDMGNVASGAEGGTAILTATAGAPANSVFISNIGNVGFGTATPVLDLHANTNNTPSLRLEQNNSGGFTAQTWDIGANEANFFVRDVTGGSLLSFRIRPGAPSSSIDISSDGDVGIGTASPDADLHVRGPTNATVTLENGGAGGNSVIDVTGGDAGLIFRQNGLNTVAIRAPGNLGIGTTSPSAQLHSTGSVRFAGLPNCAAGIVTNATGVLSCAVSSARFKDIRGALSAQKALANVMALKPQVGAYKETPEELEHWLIAEDVAAVDPALAGFQNGEPYTVKTQNIVADLVVVIQEQQRQIEELKRAIAAR